MILPPKRLKGFSHYEMTFKEDSSVGYDGTDVVTVIYDKKFLWFEREHKREFKFRRTNITKDGKSYWQQTPGCAEFVDQLEGIVKGTWTQVPTGLYNKIKEENPEYFL